MRPHYRAFNETKQQYREIFTKARALLEERLAALREDFACALCDDSNNDKTDQWLTSRHEGCGYRAWQQAALNLIEQEIGREIHQRLQQIEAYKNTFDCHMCGMCCRLASADAPYEELVVRAEAGDDFARQFTSIFLPYASRQAAQARHPEVVAAVLAHVGDTNPDPGVDSEKVFFYHCPYIGEDNRCTIFGTDKRPDICARYPETPLSFMYEKCAWRPWQDETHTDTLMAHALLALCQDYGDRLKAALV